MEGSTSTQQPATGGPEGQANSEQTTPTESLTPAQKEAVRRFKVRVDGREQEVDESELIRGYTHSQAAHARMREAAELRKRVEPLINKFEKAKKDPYAIFELGQDLGLDLRDLARQFTVEEMRYELMSDEEKRAYDREKKLSRYERAEQEWQRQQAQKRIEEAKQQAATQVETELMGFYEKLGDVPSPHLVGRTIEYLIAAHTNRQNLTVEQAHNLAKRDFDKLENETLNQKIQKMLASGDIPEEWAAAVRKADLARMRQQPPGRRTENRSDKKPEKPMNIDDWFNQRERK